MVDRYPYRMHASVAPYAIANLKLHPSVRNGRFADVEIYISSKGPSDVTTDTKRAWDAAREAEIPAIAGFRLFPEDKPTSGYAPAGGLTDGPTWERNGAHLRSLVSVLGLQPGARVPFDLEFYGGSPPNVSLAAFKLAAAPFLAAIRETGIVPCVLDARADLPMTQAIAEAAVQGVELWIEGPTFKLADRWVQDRRLSMDRLLMAKRTESAVLAQLAGHVRIHAIRHVVDDDLLRDQGGALRAEIATLGANNPWLFLRTRTDERKIGTPDWCSRTSLASSNDVKSSWFAPPLSDRTIVPFPGTVPLEIVQLPGTWPAMRADVRSEAGYLLTGGRALRASGAIPQNNDSYHVAVEVSLPADGEGPILGASWSNREAWQIVYEKATDAIWFEMRVPTAPISVERAIVIEHPSKSAPIRLFVSHESGTWILQKAQPFQPSKPMLPAGGHLYIGAGTRLGTYAYRYFEGLVFRRLERPADRFPLTSAERAAIVEKGWPR